MSKPKKSSEQCWECSSAVTRTLPTAAANECSPGRYWIQRGPHLVSCNWPCYSSKKATSSASRNYCLAQSQSTQQHTPQPAIYNEHTVIPNTRKEKAKQKPLYSSFYVDTKCVPLVASSTSPSSNPR